MHLVEATSPAAREQARALFGHHSKLRAVVDAVLDGNGGVVHVSDGSEAPAAVLFYGCYAFFGGEANREFVDKALAGQQPPLELVPGDHDRWDRALQDPAVLARASVTDRSMESYCYDGAADPLGQRVDAADSRYHVRPLEEADLDHLDSGLEPHALQALDRRTFLRVGFGWCAALDGDLAAVSTSYAISGASVEISISTRREHRQRGLAGAVGAAMTMESLQRGLTPHWNASNPVSQRLALRLGYQPIGRCRILYWS